VTNLIETCRSCGSQHLRWEQDNGWLTGSMRYLRCQNCHDCVRTIVPASTWIMFAIATVAAVWGWVVIS